MRRFLFGVLVALSLVLSFPVVVSAASSRQDDDATVTIDDPAPAQGDTVTFHVEVVGISGWTFWGECHQDLVDPDTGKVYDDALVAWFGGRTQSGDQTFDYTVTLNSPGWMSYPGPAECWAAVRNYDQSNYPRHSVYEGRLDFHVDGQLIPEDPAHA